MLTDVETGSGFTTPVLDWNNDGVIGEGDSTASGMMIDGLVTGATNVSGSGINHLFLNQSSGEVTGLPFDGEEVEAGRASWRQLK